jgi:hypothetical protein
LGAGNGNLSPACLVLCSATDADATFGMPQVETQSLVRASVLASSGSGLVPPRSTRQTVSALSFTASLP